MSRRSSEESEPDVYVGLLFVSFVALTAGIVFLIVELQSYGWQFD